MHDRTPRFASFFALVLACTAAGCIFEDDRAGPSSEQAAAFAAFCTGTLETEQKFLTPDGPGAWSGTSRRVPAGTTVYMSWDFGEWVAYTFTSDGTPAKIPGGLGTGLVEGVDFTSDCAERGKEEANRRLVLLRKSTFYADTSFTGEACTLEAATAFSSYVLGNDGERASLTAPELASTCGFDEAYSNDLVYATLISK